MIDDRTVFWGIGIVRRGVAARSLELVVAAAWWARMIYPSLPLRMPPGAPVNSFRKPRPKEARFHAPDGPQFLSDTTTPGITVGSSRANCGGTAGELDARSASGEPISPASQQYHT